MASNLIISDGLHPSRASNPRAIIQIEFEGHQRLQLKGTKTLQLTMTSEMSPARVCILTEDDYTIQYIYVCSAATPHIGAVPEQHIKGTNSAQTPPSKSLVSISSVEGSRASPPGFGSNWACFNVGELATHVSYLRLIYHC